MGCGSSTNLKADDSTQKNPTEVYAFLVGTVIIFFLILLAVVAIDSNSPNYRLIDCLKY